MDTKRDKDNLEKFFKYNISSKLKKINYDPGLDILRGISILLVVLYHLDLNYSGRVLFKGGFIGVDIFLLFLDI